MIDSSKIPGRALFHKDAVKTTGTIIISSVTGTMTTINETVDATSNIRARTTGITRSVETTTADRDAINFKQNRVKTRASSLVCVQSFCTTFEVKIVGQRFQSDLVSFGFESLQNW